jgi:hypothetical protein
MPEVGSVRAPARIGLWTFPAAAVACVPVGIAILVMLVLSSQEKLTITGDEPHYLVMADALVEDRTFDLRNAYRREEETQRIYGSRLPAPHVVIVNHRWGPYHQPGLAMLLAIPFALAHGLGARIALCLFAAMLPLCGCAFLRRHTSTPHAAWLTIGFTVGVPIAFGAAQMYPDLLAGVVTLALFVWLLDRSADTTASPPADASAKAGWAAFWLIAGLLPWLNLKYAPTTGALAAAAMLVLWDDEHRGTLRRALAASPLVLVGPAAIAAFNLYWFEKPLGPRPITEMTLLFGRGAEMFLGLHLDQGQGMFLQQPLLLAGVAAFVPFAQRRPRLALAWLGVYASLVVPNSLELARYGGGSPAGRFGWSAAWLWIVPVGYALQDAPERWLRLIKPIVIAGLVYQALLAVRWLADPGLLYSRLEEDLARRNSLFPVSMRAWLPSFYFWDFSSYWTYLPNVAAFAALGLLLVGGAAVTRTRRQAL